LIVQLLADVLVWLIALLHFGIAFAEMFLWTPLALHTRFERLI
jgi:uncharacterized membrane protein